MPNLPKCPACNSEFTYEDGGNHVCPECAHEWPVVAAAAMADQAAVVRDACGNVLQDLVEGDHDIDCKIDGIGAMQLKSEFVKKA